MTYMKEVRQLGIDFGDYDGSFGAQNSIIRGSATRWFNVGTMNAIPLNQGIAAKAPVFPSDVPPQGNKDSVFFEYVQNLSYYPSPSNS